jgi:hypothetical protein
MKHAVTLGSLLYEAWRLGDRPLRADLEAAMRAAVRREPAFADALRKALQSYTPFYRPPENRLYELASALHSAWLFADQPMRADLELAIRVYVQRVPLATAALKRVSAPTTGPAAQITVRRIAL